jgi:hypothetical protein
MGNWLAWLRPAQAWAHKWMVFLVLCVGLGSELRGTQGHTCSQCNQHSYYIHSSMRLVMDAQMPTVACFKLTIIDSQARSLHWSAWLHQLHWSAWTMPAAVGRPDVAVQSVITGHSVASSITHQRLKDKVTEPYAIDRYTRCTPMCPIQAFCSWPSKHTQGTAHSTGLQQVESSHGKGVKMTGARRYNEKELTGVNTPAQHASPKMVMLPEYSGT